MFIFCSKDISSLARALLRFFLCQYPFALVPMHVSQGQSDGIQVLKYAPKQAYVPHTDYFAYKTSGDHNWDSRNGGTNRFATVFLYLSDVEVTWSQSGVEWSVWGELM